MGHRLLTVLKSGDAAPAYLAATTDASATPTATAMTLPGGYNAFRVWTGETSPTEGEFDLYVRLNGGTAKTIRTTRWQSRVIAATSGDTISLGTSDGRTVYLAPVTAPGTLTAPSGVSGTANADQAGPPLWAPSAPHVTLTGYHQTINLAATDATKRIVFISEYTGSTWTPPRWYWLPASGSINVLCTFKQIAIANFGGVAVTVNAPTGASIGGTKARMSLPFPSVTGTSHVCSNVTDLKNAIAAAVAGDEIVLNAGTYTLDVPITRTSFVANHALPSLQGSQGIFFRGATGNRDDVVITGNGTGTNGDWLIQHDNGSALYSGFRHMTFNFAGISAGMNLSGGNWLCHNVKWTGESSSADDLITFASTHAVLTADFLECDASNAGSDCWNGDGGAAYNAASLVRLINCTGSVAGSTDVTYQVLTTHLGLRLDVYGGVYSDAVSNLSAPDSSSLITMFFTTTSPGARLGVLSDTATFACNITAGRIDNSYDNAYSLYNHVTADGLTSTVSVYRSSSTVPMPSTAVIRGNLLISTANTGRAYFPSVGASPDFERNICVGFATDAFRVANYGTGSTTAIVARSNTFYGPSAATGITVSDATLPATVTNNAVNSASGTHITGGTATTTGNYNTARTTGTYTPGANDTIGSNAAFSTTTYLPTASGNIDNNGDPNIGFVGGTDAYGWVWSYKQSAPPRGARGRPGVYPSPDLYADVWA